MLNIECIHPLFFNSQINIAAHVQFYYLNTPRSYKGYAHKIQKVNKLTLILCEKNPFLAVGFSSQSAKNMGNVFIWLIDLEKQIIPCVKPKLRFQPHPAQKLQFRNSVRTTKNIYI